MCGYLKESNDGINLHTKCFDAMSPNQSKKETLVTTTTQPRFQDDYDDEDGVSDAMFNLRKSKSSQELRSNRLSVDAAASTMMMMTRRKGSADFVTTTADGRLGEFGFGRNPFPHLETG